MYQVTIRTEKGQYGFEVSTLEDVKKLIDKYPHRISVYIKEIKTPVKIKKIGGNYGTKRC